MRFFVGLILILGCVAVHAETDALGVWIEPHSGLRFIRVKPGCFAMGSEKLLPPSGSDVWLHYAYQGHLNTDELPAHQVCLQGFLLGQHEVTASAWTRVMGSGPPIGEGDQPARGVSRLDALLFLEKLNVLSGGGGFRLPTEAEWEYACLAGAKTKDVPQPMTARLVKLEARYGQAGVTDAINVGRLKPNAWGFHDMLGNVWEWVQDAYLADAYQRHTLYDPFVMFPDARNSGLRGGSYRSEVQHIRCANRSYDQNNTALPQYGLRIAKDGVRDKP